MEHGYHKQIALTLLVSLCTPVLHAALDSKNWRPEAREGARIGTQLQQQVQQQMHYLLSPRSSTIAQIAPAPPQKSACGQQHVAKINGRCYTQAELFSRGMLEILASNVETYPFPPEQACKRGPCKRFEVTPLTYRGLPRNIVLMIKSSGLAGSVSTYDIIPNSNSPLGIFLYTHETKEAVSALAQHVTYDTQQGKFVLSSPNSPLTLHSFVNQPTEIFCFAIDNTNLAGPYDKPNLTPISCRQVMQGTLYETTQQPITPYSSNDTTPALTYSDDDLMALLSYDPLLEYDPILAIDPQVNSASYSDLSDEDLELLSMIMEY